jgi:hypothetical protein
MRYFIIEEKYSGLDKEVMMTYRQEVAQEEFIALHNQWEDASAGGYNFFRIVEITPTEMTAVYEYYC